MATLVAINATGLWWGLLEPAFGGRLEPGGRFSIGVFGSKPV